MGVRQWLEMSAQEATVDCARRKAYRFPNAESSRLFQCIAACGHVCPRHTVTVSFLFVLSHPLEALRRKAGNLA